MITKEIMEQIAHDNHMTPEAVEAEIRNAIRTAMVSSDPHAQALWKQIAPDGKEPSIDTFLRFCVDRMNKQRNS